jgi:josephin
LLQGDNAFTKEEMDALADGLEEPTGVMPSVFKKHYNIFTGNYDLQVLMAAAASRGKNIVISTRENYLDTLDIAQYHDRVVGLIVHVRRKTWVALKRIDGFWYNLDSTNGTPLLFCEGKKDMLKFLNWVLHDDGEVVTILNPALPEPPVVLAEKRHFTTKLWDWRDNWF